MLKRNPLFFILLFHISIANGNNDGGQVGAGASGSQGRPQQDTATNHQAGGPPDTYQQQYGYTQQGVYGQQQQPVYVVPQRAGVNNPGLPQNFIVFPPGNSNNGQVGTGASRSQGRPQQNTATNQQAGGPPATYEQQYGYTQPGVYGQQQQPVYVVPQPAGANNPGQPQISGVVPSSNPDNNSNIASSQSSANNNIVIEENSAGDCQPRGILDITGLIASLFCGNG